MCFIYWKYSGEIYEVSLSSRNLEDFFGENYEEASKIFGCLELEYDEFKFYNFKKLKIEDINGEKLLKAKDENMLKSLRTLI